MSSTLPRFRKMPFDVVHRFAAGVLVNRQVSTKTRLLALKVYDDGHYRALFAPDYFILRPGETAPSKSQWNSLKKKMKRHHPGVFVFKQHGTAMHNNDVCYFIEFGFFAD
ncbi:MAG: hypothetical protein Kow0077_23170 [Anaerolineae bacterium]